MTFGDRIYELHKICDKIAKEKSLNKKRAIISAVPTELQSDFQYILEILDGKHPLGYIYYAPRAPTQTEWIQFGDMTFREYCRLLYKPLDEQAVDKEYIRYICNQRVIESDFVASVLNGTLDLGIDTRLLDIDIQTLMSPQEFDSRLSGYLPYDTVYYATECLQGVRCIARYIYGEWIFTSDEGKRLRVSFDMEGVSKKHIYDGYIMGIPETQHSVIISNICNDTEKSTWEINRNSEYMTYRSSVNRLSNKKFQHEKIFTINDILSPSPYFERRMWLSIMHPASPNVRILPVLSAFSRSQLEQESVRLIDTVNKYGGQGILVYNGNASYTHGKTDDVLLIRDLPSLEMTVIDTIEGSGEFAGLVGALQCMATLSDGTIVTAAVNEGFSVEQRCVWAFDAKEIIDKTILVSYFSLQRLTKSAVQKVYSATFAKFKSIVNTE